MENEIVQVETGALRPHPKNSFYFDDITGEKWNDFIKSYQTFGQLEPCIVSADNVIISGHQRWRAAKETGAATVPCIYKSFDTDEDMEMALIDSNTKQRGSINSSKLKLGRIIKFEEEHYGVAQGRPSLERKENPNNVGVKSEDIAAKHHVDNDETYRQLKRLAEADPKIQEMLEHDLIGFSSVSRIVSKLNPEEQKQLAELLPEDEMAPMARVKELADQIKAKEASIKEIQEECNGLQTRLEKYVRRSSDLEDELRTEKLRKTDEDILEENDKLKIENRKFYESAASAKKMEEIAKKNVEFYKNSAENYLKRIAEMKENGANGFIKAYTEEVDRQIKLVSSFFVSISDSIDSLGEDDRNEMCKRLESLANVLGETISKLNKSSKAA